MHLQTYAKISAVFPFWKEDTEQLERKKHVFYMLHITVRLVEVESVCKTDTTSTPNTTHPHQLRLSSSSTLPPSEHFLSKHLPSSISLSQAFLSFEYLYEHHTPLSITLSRVLPSLEYYLPQNTSFFRVSLFSSVSFLRAFLSLSIFLFQTTFVFEYLFSSTFLP